MRNRAFTLVELMVVIGILTLLVSVLATAVVPKMMKAKHDLDAITLHKLYNEVQINIETDTSKKHLKQLNSIENGDRRGVECWELLFRKKVLGPEMLEKLIAQAGPDTNVDQFWVDSEEPLPASACSWTAPRAVDLPVMMRLSGGSRRVVTCSNSRNWNNYEDEVLVQWSDGQTSTYVTLEDLSEYYEVSEEEWLSPGDSLFGQKAPFDGVWD